MTATSRSAARRRQTTSPAVPDTFRRAPSSRLPGRSSGPTCWAMMADNIEHVISYWVVFQKFHSPALAGFAVISHWLPFLMFSVAAGALADRFDPRRVIQCGMAAVHHRLTRLELFLHHRLAADVARDGAARHPRLCRGPLADAQPAAALRTIVGPAELMSATCFLMRRALSRRRSLGSSSLASILPALGPAHGILLNTVFYLPLVPVAVVRIRALSARGSRCGARKQGVADIGQVARSTAGRNLVIWSSMTLLAGFIVFLSAMPTTRRCRALPRISAMATPALPTARCWRPMRPARLAEGRWLEGCYRAAGNAHGSDPGHGVAAARYDRIPLATSYPAALAALSPQVLRAGRSSRWRRRWCSSMRRSICVAGSSACSTWRASGFGRSAAYRSACSAA